MFNFLRKKTALDVLNESVITMYGKYAENSLSDSDLLETVQTSMRAFKESSIAKKETIPANILMNISAFMVMYRSKKSKDEWLTHLNSEVDIYLHSGLRKTYVNNNLIKLR